jgi:dephospho-CoA kinase
MIVGITGAICAGKRALAKYLVETYGFESVNLLEVFRSKLNEQ